MPKYDDLKRNASGYYDPTAYEAIKKLMKKTKNFINFYIQSFIFANLPGLK